MKGSAARRKNGKDKPKILLKEGKTDKLIRDYLEAYRIAEKREKDVFDET